MEFHSWIDRPSRYVAVLGGSGFIGSRAIPTLLERGQSVRSGDVHKSEAFPNLWAECDVRDYQQVRQFVSGSDVVINLAAEHRDDVRPLSRYREVNVLGAANVCRAAREEGIEKIIFTSSVAVYGFHPHPVGEEGPFAPFNEYGKTKLEAEEVFRQWAKEASSRSLVIVRPTVVFGERNRGNVYNLLRQVATNRFFMVGSGQNVKSMAYVGNVAAFLVHALSLGSGTHIFNYVDGPDMNMKNLTDYIRHCLGKSGETPRVPKAVAMVGGLGFDAVARLSGRRFPISAIRVRKFCESTQFKAERITETGFASPYSLEEGLARTVRFEFPAQ
jgi:nucleoside-diphosphate-sugar epimerase